MNRSLVQSWVPSAPPATVKTSSTTEAGASARRKASFLSAMAEATEGIGTHATLAVRLGIAANGPAVAAKRLRRSFGTIVNTASRLGILA